MMRYETKKIRENMCYNGVMILRCECTYPCVGVCQGFFEEILKKCLLWAKEKLYTKLIEEYDGDKNPKKRFTFGYEYRARIEEKELFEGYLELVFYSEVKKRGSRELLYKNEKSFTVRLSDGALIPENIALKAKKRQYKQKNDASAVVNDEN